METSIKNGQVYKAISKITMEIGKDGISKTRKNQQQGYNFRGIDEVFNALNPLLSANGLCILPFVLERQCDERVSGAGKVLFYVTVKMRFDFVSAEDGSTHAVIMYGEAMDSADKATNKAMSAAYKYAAIQAFCIPTEGDNDADAQTHEVAPRSHTTPSKASDAEADAEVHAQFNAAADISSLTKVMNSLSQDEKRLYVTHFNARMAELKKGA
jgi:hypothetical protein